MSDTANLCVVSSPADPFDERAMVDRARSDPEAFGQLYRRHLAHVYGYAHRRTGNRAAAEDITSATFESALKNLHRFRWRSGGFAPWLLRIAANHTIAHYRREGRPSSMRGQVAMATMFQGESVDELPLDGGNDDLRQALDNLTPRYQRAISLRYLAELQPEAAAQAMGMTKPALAVVLSRALKALRREIERLEEWPHV